MISCHFFCCFLLLFRQGQQMPIMECLEVCLSYQRWQSVPQALLYPVCYCYSEDQAKWRSLHNVVHFRFLPLVNLWPFLFHQAAQNGHHTNRLWPFHELMHEAVARILQTLRWREGYQKPKYRLEFPQDQSELDLGPSKRVIIENISTILPPLNFCLLTLGSCAIGYISLPHVQTPVSSACNRHMATCNGWAGRDCLKKKALWVGPPKGGLLPKSVWCAPKKKTRFRKPDKGRHGLMTSPGSNTSHQHSPDLLRTASTHIMCSTRLKQDLWEHGCISVWTMYRAFTLPIMAVIDHFGPC